MHFPSWGALSIFPPHDTVEMNNHGCYLPQAELLFFWICVHSWIERVSDQTYPRSVCHPSPRAPYSQVCSLLSEMKHLLELKACAHHLRNPVMHLRREKSWQLVAHYRTQRTREESESRQAAAGCCESPAHTSVPPILLSGSPAAHLPWGALPTQACWGVYEPKEACRWGIQVPQKCQLWPCPGSSLLPLACAWSCSETPPHFSLLEDPESVLGALTSENILNQGSLSCPSCLHLNRWVGLFSVM